jgi:hypothetical protein
MIAQGKRAGDSGHQRTPTWVRKLSRLARYAVRKKTLPNSPLGRGEGREALGVGCDRRRPTPAASLPPSKEGIFSGDEEIGRDVCRLG